MAKKLYALRNVPNDEIEEMRMMLREHDIAFHETEAGFFGIGTAAFWVNDASQYEQANTLIKEYQLQRYQQAREAYETRIARGEEPGLVEAFRTRPGKTIIYLVIALLFLALMTGPYWL